MTDDRGQGVAIIARIRPAILPGNLIWTLGDAARFERLPDIVPINDVAGQPRRIAAFRAIAGQTGCRRRADLECGLNCLGKQP